MFVFVTSVLKLLEEDGWLSPMAQKGFFTLFGFCLPYDPCQTEMLGKISNGTHMHKCYT
jgi:hypothetical protein